MFQFSTMTGCPKAPTDIVLHCILHTVILYTHLIETTADKTQQVTSKDVIQTFKRNKRSQQLFPVSVKCLICGVCRLDLHHIFKKCRMMFWQLVHSTSNLLQECFMVLLW